MLTREDQHTEPGEGSVRWWSISGTGRSWIGWIPEMSHRIMCCPAGFLTQAQKPCRATCCFWFCAARAGIASSVQPLLISSGSVGKHCSISKLVQPCQSLATFACSTVWLQAFSASDCQEIPLGLRQPGLATHLTVWKWCV